MLVQQGLEFGCGVVRRDAPLRGVVWGPCFMHLSSVGSLPLAKNALHLVGECSAFLASGSDATNARQKNDGVETKRKG